MPVNKRGFQLINRGPLQYLQSPLIAAGGRVDHAFSTRPGGCSTGAMASLNTAFHTGDDYRCVLENRRRFLEPWGYSPADITSGIQVHGSGIIEVRVGDRGRGAAPGSFLGEGDGLVTASGGVLLAAYAADCLLLFFYVPDVPLVALAHAGWRGTLEGMAPAVVSYLKEVYSVDPAAIRVAVSPGICARCYLVDRIVADQFSRAGWTGPPYLEETAGGRFKLDLAAINRVQLLDCGIRKTSLAGGTWCTACRPDLFYSYRRDRGDTGRMMGFIALRPRDVRRREHER